MDQDRQPEKRIVFAIPSYSSVMDMAGVFSLIAELQHMQDKGWGIQFINLNGDGLVGRVRNTIATQFLDETDGTDLFWLDDDVAWTPGAITRLCELPYDLAAGCYRMRQDPEHYPVSFVDAPFIPTDQETGCIRLNTVMGGFTRMTRRCLEKMRQNSVPYTGPDGKPCWDFFEHGVKDSVYWGEDSAFCRRWVDLGQQIWVDPCLELKHIGKKVFTGSLAKWLLENHEKHTGKSLERAKEEAEKLGGAPMTMAEAEKVLKEMENPEISFDDAVQTLKEASMANKINAAVDAAVSEAAE